MKKREFDLQLIPLIIALALLLSIPLLAIAGAEYHFWEMNAGDDAYVVCEDGYLQADFTMAHPRPTPTNDPNPSPYPGPITQYRTSVYIVCTGEEVGLQSIRAKQYFPLISK